MFLSIDVVQEQFYAGKDKDWCCSELKNKDGKLGSKELDKVSKEYHLVDFQKTVYNDRTYPNVTVIVQTYIFSKKKKSSSITSI